MVYPRLAAIKSILALCLISRKRSRRITYPFSKLATKSLCGPSGAKLVTLKKLVLWLSLGPLFVAIAYLRISRPVLVACSSGVAARRPIKVILAKDPAVRGAEVEKARALEARERRRRKEDISNVPEFAREGYTWVWESIGDGMGYCGGSEGRAQVGSTTFHIHLSPSRGSRD
jgi:hypothetical protein